MGSKLNVPSARLGDRRPLRSALALALVLPLAVPPRLDAGPRGPQEDAEPSAWRLEGSVTGRYEYYDVEGDRFQSPYRFTGSEPYGEVRLSLERRLSGYHQVRAQFLGIVNDNHYRSPHDGVVVERASLVVENGTARMPYRLEFGDTFAYFSQRTVQRPLKGVQLELQSPLGSSGRRQSLDFVAGLYEASWRDLGLKDDFTTGVSWLLDDPDLGTWSVNYLNNIRGADGASPRLEQRQFGVAAQVYLADRLVSVEGEASHLRDVRRESEAGEPTRSDEGYFLQVQNARSRHPLLYRARYEWYGEDYRPAGAPIIPHRRTAEGHLGWRFQGGVELRGRLQHFRDAFEGTNPFDNTTLGLTLRGPALRSWAPGLVTNIDLFVRDSDDRSGALDTRTSSLTVDAWQNIRGQWTPRVRFFFQDANDRTFVNEDLRVSELVLGTDRVIGFGGFSGTFGPGLLLRRVRDGIRTSNDYYPQVGLNVARGPHSLRQDLGFSTLGRRLADGIDVDTLMYNMLYRYARPGWGLGLEASNQNRDADPGEDTNSWRLAGYVTWQFQGGGARPTAGEPVWAPPAAGPFDLAQLVPGTAMQAVAIRLQGAGIVSPIQLGNRSTYETTVVEEIPQRQQLVLIGRDEVLERAALVIEADDLGGGSFIQAFERARQVFIARYGTPDNVYEEGEAATADVHDAVNRGTLVRVLEWRRAGATLRFGIPARLDGRLTMELQQARSLPPVTDTRWSINDARQ